MSDETVGRIEFGGVVSKEDADRMRRALFATPAGTLVAVHAERPPLRNENPAVWDAVIEDMKARDAFGRAKYGTPLQVGNGRDALVDAYQEALDLVVYLKQAILEREAKR